MDPYDPFSDNPFDGDGGSAGAWHAQPGKPPSPTGEGLFSSGDPGRRRGPAVPPVADGGPDDGGDDGGPGPEDLAQYARLHNLLAGRIQQSARKTGFSVDEILHALTNPVASVPDPQNYHFYIVLGYADASRRRPLQLTVGKQGGPRPLEITGAVAPFNEEYLPLYRDDEHAFCARHRVDERRMESMRAIRRGMPAYASMPVGVHERTLEDFLRAPLQDEAPKRRRRRARPDRNGPVTVSHAGSPSRRILGEAGRLNGGRSAEGPQA